jgi:hypothetical protein
MLSTIKSTFLATLDLDRGMSLVAHIIYDLFLKVGNRCLNTGMSLTAHIIPDLFLNVGNKDSAASRKTLFNTATSLNNFPFHYNLRYMER